MKKTKLLTSLAAFVLVLGLGACNEPEEEKTTSDESGEVTTTDTEDTSEGETTPEGGNEPVAYAIVGDFDDNSWNESPATDSVYYIPAGTEHYEATVEVPTADTLGYEPSFRVVEYGTWNLVADYDNLDVDNSTGVTGSHGNDNNIELAGGTYDLVFEFGETNSILVTLQTEEGGDEGGDTEPIKGLLGYEYEGINYYIDGTMFANYNYEGNITANIDEAVEVTATETEGDNAYYLTFELNTTIYYVCIIVIDGGYTDLQYTTEPNAIYYDETLDGWVNEAGTYFLCYNATFKCFYASALSDYGPNSSNPSPIAHIYDYPTIEGIALSADSQEVYITSTLNITVTYTPSTIGASNLEWVSSDNDVATVTDGVVTGVAEGEVTITATTLNSLTATITLNVVAAPVDVELSIEITPESLAAEYDTDVNSHTNISGNTSIYGGGAVTVTWTGSGTGICPWNSVSNTNNVSTIRIYSGSSITVTNGTGLVSRVVIDAAWGSNNSSNGCGTSFSATNATVGTAVTTDLGDEIEITLNSGATSTTITRSGSVCYCSGITVYYYAV